MYRKHDLKYWYIFKKVHSYCYGHFYTLIKQDSKNNSVRIKLCINVSSIPLLCLMCPVVMLRLFIDYFSFNTALPPDGIIPSDKMQQMQHCDIWCNRQGCQYSEYFCCAFIDPPVVCKT